MIERDPALAEPLVPGLPYLRAEAVYAARYEMARTRRRRAVPPDPGTLLARDETAAMRRPTSPRSLAADLGWDEAEQRARWPRYRAAVDARARRPRTSPKPRSKPRSAPDRVEHRRTD